MIRTPRQNRLLRLLLLLLIPSACGALTPAPAQSEGYVPAEPRLVVPERLDVTNCGHTVLVHARWLFPDGGYRAPDTFVIQRSGQTINLDARVERFNGGAILVITPAEKTYDLGPLAPGSYTLVFKSYGAVLRTRQFTVGHVISGAAPVDQPCFFVRQHYQDFLSRDPEGAGFAYWVSQLTDCGTDAACVALRRENVSAAFFLSIEFQNTGFYVHRLYRAAFGRAPRYAEFVADSRQVGQRVVVGASGEAWQIRLDSNKSVFAGDFTQRPEFRARYDALTNEQYVDKLYETAGVTPTPAERDAALSCFNNPCGSLPWVSPRAAVLRRVAESESVTRKEHNPAFVLMQYFGYLRRNPDDPPDGNMSGYDFWLAKLNSFGGDYIAAQMVQAFITSGEYRARFPQQ